MTKAIETLAGADATAFRAAIAPHIGAVLDDMITVPAEAARDDAIAARDAAAGAEVAAEAARDIAVGASGTATAAQAGAVAAKESAETALADTNAAKTAALGAKTASETARDAAVAARDAAVVASARVSPLSSRAGWLHAYIDGANNLLGGWRSDGSFWSALTGSIDATIASIQANAVTLAASITNLAGKLPATVSARTGWLHVYTDSANYKLGGWRLDGSFWTAISGSVDAAIATLQSSVATLITKLPATISTRAGWLHVFTDSANNKLFGADAAGDFWAGPTNVSQFFRDGGLPVATKALIYPAADLALWGDSETENNLAWSGLTAKLTAAGLTRNLYTWGLGGQSGRSILARQGGQPAQITFPANARGFPEIPAGTGATSVTVIGAPLSYADINQAKSMTGYVMAGGIKISGTLTRTAGTNNYTFARAAAGTAMEVDAALPMVPDNDALIARTLISWLGTNDLIPAATAASALFNNMLLYEARQSTLTKRHIVIMPVWCMDTTAYPDQASRKAIYAALLALVKDRWPNSYIDTVAIGQRAVASPDANDLADIAAGLIPRSIQAGDRLHFPAGGTFYSALETEIVNIIKRNGW